MKRSKYHPRIEITTFADTKRVFLEPCYRLDPGVEWAIHHPREAPELTLTWWQFIKYLWRDAW